MPNADLALFNKEFAKSETVLVSQDHPALIPARIPLQIPEPIDAQSVPRIVDRKPFHFAMTVPEMDAHMVEAVD